MTFIVIDENGDEAGTIKANNIETAQRIAKKMFGEKATVKEEKK